MRGSRVTLSGFIEDKRQVIISRLSDNAPTIILSRDEGVYIFSQSFAKAHSTIILAGVGQNFPDIGEWFRWQIDQLVLRWSPNVPRAEKEVEILPRVFHPNTEGVSRVVYADLVLVEIREILQEDVFFRINFLGDVTRFRDTTAIVVSYKAPVSKRNGDDEFEEDEGEDEELVRKDLESVGVGDQTILAEPDAPNRLIRTYLGKKGFLDREKLRRAQYQWVYRSL